MGALRDIVGTFVDHPEHWGPLFLHGALFKFWLPICLTPLLLLGLHHLSTMAPTVRRTYRALLGVTLCAFSGLYLIRAASNVLEPPEWDMLAFWTFGKVAAAGQNFYSPSLFHEVARAHPEHEAFADPLFVRDVLDVGFPYPPPSILLIAPLGFFELRAATAVWYVLQLIALAAAIVLLWRTFLGDKGWLGLAVVAALVLTLHATYTTIALVQTNFLVLLLLTAFWRDQARALGGLYVGLGIVIKPFVGFVLLYLALRRQWGALATAAVTIVALCAATVGVFGWEPFATYTATNPASNLPGWIYEIEANQSLAAAYVRLISHDVSSGSPLIQPAYLAVATVLAAFTLVLAWIHRRSDPALAFGMMLPAALLLYPQSWSHYAVILVLPIMLLWTQRAHWHLTTPVAVVLISAVYALARSDGLLVSPTLLMWVVFTALSIAALARGRRGLSSLLKEPLVGSVCPSASGRGKVVPNAATEGSP